MQSIFAAAMSAVLANNTKRAREDDDVADGRNVRSRSDTAPPVASTSTAAAVPDAPMDAPDAPDAPTRSNDPARELVFGPVNWKKNINSECRTIIAEGMKTRPNMRGFYTRRGPDNQYIICGFETAGATDWFVNTWMSERSGRWSSVVARPNV
jgi:hypothetical protein